MKISATLLFWTATIGAPAYASIAPQFPPRTAPISSAIDESVEELITQGRAQLAEANFPLAKELFDRAATKDHSSLRTKVWQLRVAMQLESLNDVLGRIDEISKHHDGASIQYLYGMAFAVKGQQALDAGLNDGTIGMQLIDSQSYLSQALEHNGELYSDAYPVLARVAWMNRDFDIALAAADKAVGYFPKSSSNWSQRGRIQLDRYNAIRAADDQAQAAQERLDDAIKSHKKALELLGDDVKDGRSATRALIWKQVGDCEAWNANMPASSNAYSAAMGWDPTVLDYGQLWNTLANRFVASLDEGEKQFAKRWGAETQADATLLWYLGYARYTANKGREFKDAAKVEFQKAEKELLLAVKKRPDYANGLWYVGLSRYGRSDFIGAAKAIADFWQRDPSGVVATVGAELEWGVARIEYIIGQCVGANRLLLAATLSEVLAETDPPGALNWSYKALFLRDHADRLAGSGQKTADDSKIQAFYEESLSAYERALELEPGNPNFMNDLAVVLHYNLRRDFERCLELYDAAHARAEELMNDPEVNEQRKVDFISIALRDSKNNANLLRKQLKKQRENSEE